MPYEKRADALGKLGLFYGIGMVVGPFVGGQITKNLGYVLHRYLALMRRKNSNIIFSISLTRYVWLGFSLRPQTVTSGMSWLSND